MEEVRFQITNLSELEYRLIRNALILMHKSAAVESQVWANDIANTLKKVPSNYPLNMEV